MDMDALDMMYASYMDAAQEIAENDGYDAEAICNSRGIPLDSMSYSEQKMLANMVHDYMRK